MADPALRVGGGIVPTPLHERLDLAATAGASFSVSTSRDDIDALAAGLRAVQ